ncbi:hypothetical protein FZO89_10440 [Luteimonas viscosa]|uniref:DUF937 domain-containing protein n=1 Tax=Luteimonas viscosa TaxID=1132694 RepID=A0A5D4XUH2_9GAMM|nr:hypothetical protein [Luteimonas viscosa]TYT26642.1 hypothetical protein FZO89_10440 [Luteimonas viscosa]
MSDGSDGAGGVGNDGGNSADNGVGAADSATGLGEAMADAVSGLADAVSQALGLDADALGNALSGLADALGLETQDLQDIVGAALLGAITGGLPGAVMGVVNGLVGGSLSDAARDAVAANVPEAMQPFANLAIDAFASRVPGANTSLDSALASFASGALTNGRAPDIGDIGAVARSLADVRSLANGVVSGLDVSSADAAAASIERALGTHFAEARAIATGVADGFARSGTAHADGGHGPFGDGVEALAVDVVRMLANR